MLDPSGQEPDLSGPDSPHFSLPDTVSDSEQAAPADLIQDSDAKAELNAWEEVAEGRFMPKRVRGSCHGRALG